MFFFHTKKTRIQEIFRNLRVKLGEHSRDGAEPTISFYALGVRSRQNILLVKSFFPSSSSFLVIIIIVVTYDDHHFSWCAPTTLNIIVVMILIIIIITYYDGRHFSWCAPTTLERHNTRLLWRSATRWWEYLHQKYLNHDHHRRYHDFNCNHHNHHQMNQISHVLRAKTEARICYQRTSSP